MLKVVALKTEVTINLLPSKVALVKVDPDKPETSSNMTMSSSNKFEVEDTVTVTVFEDDVLVKLAPVIVVLIG